jgi:glycosyltransferase involved in cell wall biosynthesis
MPQVSVIIPVYNGEKTIRETIKSVLQQTFADFEIIVINDGSTDATLEILFEIQDPRIQIFSYPNARQAASRNRGLEHAQGDYIAFLDADDLWIRDKLELQFKALQSHPEAAFAYSWTDYIDERGNFLHSGRHMTMNGNVYADLIVNNFVENGSNPLIRREVFDRVGVFDEALPPAEDWDMWLRIASCYPFVAIPATQVLYRVTSTSSSLNIAKQEQQCLEVLQRGFDRASPEIQQLKPKSYANLYKYLTWKAIEGYPSRKNGMAAARSFYRYLQHNPSVILSPKFMASVIAKIAIMLVLPSKQALTLLKAIKKKSRGDNRSDV